MTRRSLFAMIAGMLAGRKLSPLRKHPGPLTATAVNILGAGTCSNRQPPAWPAVNFESVTAEYNRLAAVAKPGSYTPVGSSLGFSVPFVRLAAVDPFETVFLQHIYEHQRRLREEITAAVLYRGF
jgi:hypothetical protein